jgi:hypothetical protein
MSETNQPVASVIRPGKESGGPPGWEERRVEKQLERQNEHERKNHQRQNSSGMQGIKDKVHRIGEKMHLIEPKDPSQRSPAQLQVSGSTVVTV